MLEGHPSQNSSNNLDPDLVDQVKLFHPIALQLALSGLDIDWLNLSQAQIISYQTVRNTLLSGIV